MANNKAKNVQYVVEWRRRAKKRLVTAFGGKCGICGYNKCDRNLVFHHIDPSQKEFAFGQLQSKAWLKLVEEVKKCVMLCHNCHGEVHEGIIDIIDCPRFNEEFMVYDRKSV